jgi:hypothetical protein
MARAQASMNARSTAASDWVDYALNQRTVVDPSTGQLTKVSSSYTYPNPSIAALGAKRSSVQSEK